MCRGECNERNEPMTDEKTELRKCAAWKEIICPNCDQVAIAGSLSHWLAGRMPEGMRLSRSFTNYAVKVDGPNPVCMFCPSCEHSFSRRSSWAGARGVRY
jgi:hypothetical protein